MVLLCFVVLSSFLFPSHAFALAQPHGPELRAVQHGSRDYIQLFDRDQCEALRKEYQSVCPAIFCPAHTLTSTVTRTQTDSGELKTTTKTITCTKTVSGGTQTVTRTTTTGYEHGGTLTVTKTITTGYEHGGTQTVTKTVAGSCEHGRSVTVTSTVTQPTTRVSTKTTTVEDQLTVTSTVARPTTTVSTKTTTVEDQLTVTSTVARPTTTVSTKTTTVEDQSTVTVDKTTSVPTTFTTEIPTTTTVTSDSTTTTTTTATATFSSIMTSGTTTTTTAVEAGPTGNCLTFLDVEAIIFPPSGPTVNIISQPATELDQGACCVTCQTVGCIAYTVDANGICILYANIEPASTPTDQCSNGITRGITLNVSDQGNPGGFGPCGAGSIAIVSGS